MTAKEKLLSQALSTDGPLDMLNVKRCIDAVMAEQMGSQRNTVTYSPRDIMCAAPYYGRELFGLESRRFWRLNERKEDDAGIYVFCVESLPMSGVLLEVVYLAVWGMLPQNDDVRWRKWIKQLPPALEGGHWNQAKILYLVIKVLVDLTGEGRVTDCQKLLDLLAVENREERCARVLSAQNYILNQLQGDVDNDKMPNGNPDLRRKRLIGLFKSLQEISVDWKCARTELINGFWGFSAADEKEANECIKCGELPMAQRVYAEAVITIFKMGIPVDENNLRVLIVRALIFYEPAHNWVWHEYKCVSLTLAATMLSLPDVIGGWKNFWTASCELRYRCVKDVRASTAWQLNKIYDVCFETAVCMIDGLIRAGKMDYAKQIWQDVWCDCVRALYAFSLYGAPIRAIQCLFVYFAMNFSGSHEDNERLLENLPFVRLQNGDWISCRDACVKTLELNRR